MLQNLETLLLTENCQDAFWEVTDFYITDIDSGRLQSQLLLLHSSQSPDLTQSLQDVFSYFRSLSDVEKDFFSEVIKVWSCQQ